MARRRPLLRGLSRAIPPILVLALTLPAMAQPICVCLRCVLFTHHNFYAPSSSMHPTLPTDSCFESRYVRNGDPVPPPGSVVHYAHPVNDQAYVARIVAHEGQTVQMLDGHLQIDGAPVVMEEIEPFVEQMEPSSSGWMPVCPTIAALGDTCEIAQFLETLPNGVSYRVLDIRSGTAGDDTAQFIVPDGYVFVLGDNRDNSLDSRFPQRGGGVGMVPVENIYGVVDRPATSLE